MNVGEEARRARNTWKRGDYGEAAKQEVEFGFRQMREGNVGKKRIVIELDDVEPPKISVEITGKPIISADLSRAFERFTKSVEEWGKRGDEVRTDGL